MPETSDVVLTPPVPAFLGVCVYGGGGDGVLTVTWALAMAIMCILKLLGALSWGCSACPQAT